MAVSLPGFGKVNTTPQAARFESVVKKGNHVFSQGGSGKNPVGSKPGYFNLPKRMDVQIKGG